MHPATLEGLFNELELLEKVAQDYVDDAHEKAQSSSGLGKKVLKGTAIAGGALGAAALGKHYAGKGLTAVKNGIREAVHEGVRSGTKGAFWNSLKRP